MRIKLDAGAFVPERAHELDAGLDLRSPDNYLIPAKGSAVIDTGVHVNIPMGWTGFLKSKSGLNVKYGITSEGVIDSGYSGAIIAKLYNNSDKDYAVSRGDKITQLVILPCLLTDVELDDFKGGARGEAGFGSTGR